MEFWVVQALNGLSFGALLFLLASGLSLIFGLMRIVNISHGSYYLLGAYVGLSVMKATGRFLLACLAGAAAVAVVGIVMQRVFLARMYREEQRQVLLTMGFAFVFADAALWLWGGDPQRLPTPAVLSGYLPLGPATFPIYRLAVVATGAVVAVVLWFFQERTRLGAVVRAAVDDEEMARGLGIHVRRVLTAVFAAGAALAAFGGVMGGPFLGVYPGADSEVLPLAFAVVIIGGLGSLQGALVGSLLVGLVDNFGKALFPELSYFTLFVPMAVVLAIRPTGLFGRR
ncbi:MAG: branched-chain amino acid ABC transporter permease [Armatimonadota bacterium]|nr:branched-chain amino acid ABC transporter permease [Armatimonadota bacterium]